MNRVRAAFFNFTPPAPAGDDISGYLRWHALDHMPEQYQLPGILHGTRWMADRECREARVAGSGNLAEVGSVVNYLVTEPVQPTHDDFMQLGPRLALMGRFPEHRPSLQLTMPALHRWYSSPRVQISAEVVPFRPHRGVVVVVEEPVTSQSVGGEPDGGKADRWEPTGGETLDATTRWQAWLHAEHYPVLMDHPAVAGAWMYGSSRLWRLHPDCRRDPHYVTVIYLDDDPVKSVETLTPVLEQRWAAGGVTPQFAGPLRSVVHWEAWPD
jgi:hypothetical protein